MEINKIQNMVEEDGIVFLTYGGFLSQALISSMAEALEKEAEESELKMGDASNIFTIFIEISQNMMNYSKNRLKDELKSEGLIVVSKDGEGHYFIHSQNIVCKKDKEKIEPKLKEIQSMDRDGLKKKYRELRRSGRDAHGKGGGIGFYEIAKRCDKIEYEFKKINEEKYYFYLKTYIKTNKGNE